MKLQKISLSIRNRLVIIILITIAAIAIPATASYYKTPQASYYQTSRAVSQANSSGLFSIIWGDPYLAPQTAQGRGWETLSITGSISQQPNLPGYYRYATINLNGRLHAEWSDTAGLYVLDATFSLSSYETLYQETTLNPSTNSFYVSFMDCSATLQVNGHATSASGQAGVKAAVPGYFEQHGQSRVTTFIIYAPELGDLQFVFRWSQTSQTVDGVQLPAATRLSQTIGMTG